MKYLIMMNQSSDDTSPGQEWTPEDVKASWACMQQIYQELSDAGELIATEKLAGPHAAKIVTSDGVNAPVITDGPFPEAKEFLAGFWMVDVDSEQRAVDIAARTSASPGPGGQPMRAPIEVRPIMDAPASEW
ncbi:MAG TPA: hypothetical protein DGT23_21770 [Micromonosporaceae bacterium]|nr:hypothetical protein [Micromonosporaceae bacterium]